jgi:phosphopantetheinyl transferase
MSPDRYESYRMGRMTAHEALALWLPRAVHLRTAVLRGPLGQPLATADDADVAEVSIAHCQGWAAAVVSERGRPFGVDVERRSADTEGPAMRASSPGQLTVACGTGLDPGTAALLLWTAREAAGKALRTGLVVAPEVLDIDVVEEIGRDVHEVRYRNLPALTGVTRVLDDVVVSLATLRRGTGRLLVRDERQTTGTTGRAWRLVVGQPDEVLDERADARTGNWEWS